MLHFVKATRDTIKVSENVKMCKSVSMLNNWIVNTLKVVNEIQYHQNVMNLYNSSYHFSIIIKNRSFFLLLFLSLPCSPALLSLTNTIFIWHFLWNWTMDFLARKIHQFFKRLTLVRIQLKLSKLAEIFVAFFDHLWCFRYFDRMKMRLHMNDSAVADHFLIGSKCMKYIVKIN